MYTESSRVKQTVMSAKCWSLSLAHQYRITDRLNNWSFNAFFYRDATALVGQCRLIIEDS
jgi:hypothetical protein